MKRQTETPKEKTDALTPRPLDRSKAVRGKYFDRMQEGTNIVLLAPDLIDTFPDSESVNEALRGLKKVASRSVRASQGSEKTTSSGR